MPPSSSPASTLRRSVGIVWRTLRSMRTALVLLLAIALASAAGSLLPQIPNSPERVVQYLRDHEIWGELLLRAQLFDVFGSWWFSLLMFLLFVSLVACLLPRSRAMIRAIRQAPVQAREIDAFPQYREVRVGAEPDDALSQARRVVRRRGFRVASDPGNRALAAEKGILREAGSLVFHWAFIVLLVGVILGKGTGYAGRAVIVEGQTWTDAEANYDGQLRTGRFFTSGHSGIQIHLDTFSDRYADTGVPMDFVSSVELTSADGSDIDTAEVRVNHPVSFGGVRIFQFGFGWAAVIEVERNEQAIRSAPVVMTQDTAPEGVSQLAMPWIGFVKLTTLRPQVAVKLELWPDGGAFFQALQTGELVPMIRAVDPVIRYRVYTGKLVDPSQATLDTHLMKRTASGVIGRGQTVDLQTGCPIGGDAPLPTTGRACPEGAADPSLTMTFPEVRRYSVLQVSRDRGVPLVLAGAILILLGLLPALYTSRRKVWVRVEPDDGGSVLKVGGFALQRKEQFEQEFDRLVAAIGATGEASG